MMQTVRIKSSPDLTLRGILHLPEGWEGHSRTATLLLPGLVGNRVGPHRILVDLAQQLSSYGFPTLRCDPPGSGYSDGDNEHLCFSDLLQGVRDMMDYLEREIGATTFILGGVCRGSRLALSTALIDRRVKRLILLSCPRLHETTQQKKGNRRRWYHLKEYGRKFVTFRWVPRLFSGDLNFKLIGSALFNPINRVSLRKSNTPDHALDPRQLAIPSLFIYGENDPDLTSCLTYYQNSENGGNAKDLTFYTIADADHGFYSRQWHETVLSHVQDWWSSHHT